MTSHGPLSMTTPARLAFTVIVGALMLRLVLAFAIGLGTDEIYTLAISRQLSWSYFDHPPLHQWLAHASAWLLGEGRQVRLPFIVLFAATSWLLFLITRRLYGENAGLWAVITLNLSGFFTLSAGSWVVPDGVLMFALALAGYALSRRFFPVDGEPSHRSVDWLLAGLGLGLAGLAKYHAALAAIGIMLFVLSTARGRAELRHPAPWIAAVLALALVLPVLVWNVQNGWASFQFQAGRTQGAGFAPWLVPASLLAQAGWLLPWVFVPLLAGVLLAWRTLRDERFWFLMALALPSIIVFTLLPAFGNLGLPHWAMPGWFFIMPLAGLHLARLADLGSKPTIWSRRAAIGSVVVLALIGSHAASGWLARIIPALPRHDPTLETFGWDQLRDQIAARQLLPPGDFIMADSWQNAGRIDVALAGAVPVMPGTLDPRHFAFIVNQRSLIGRNALIIVRARREQQMRTSLKDHFATLGAGVPIALGRYGLAEIELVAIPASRFVRALPWAYGVHP